MSPIVVTNSSPSGRMKRVAGAAAGGDSRGLIEPTYSAGSDTSLHREDFSSYADTAALKAGYTNATSATFEKRGTIHLDTTDAPSGYAKSFRVDWRKNPQGLAESATANTVTMLSGFDSDSVDMTNTAALVMSGTGAGSAAGVRNVTAWDAGTRTATLSSNWGTTPDATSMMQFSLRSDAEVFLQKTVSDNADPNGVLVWSYQAKWDADYQFSNPITSYTNKEFLVYRGSGAQEGWGRVTSSITDQGAAVWSLAGVQDQSGGSLYAQYATEWNAYRSFKDWDVTIAGDEEVVNPVGSRKIILKTNRIAGFTTHSPQALADANTWNRITCRLHRETAHNVGDGCFTMWVNGTVVMHWDGLGGNGSPSYANNNVFTKPRPAFFFHYPSVMNRGTYIDQSRWFGDLRIFSRGA